MSNSRKSSKAGSGLLQNNSTGSGGAASASTSGPAGHQHHKNLRRHLDMGIGSQPSYGGNGGSGQGSSSAGGALGALDGSGSGGPGSQMATANLFEIKKRSIDFFQHVSAPF